MRTAPMTDAELLVALDMRDRLGMTYEQIARALRQGRSKVIGALARIDAATAPSRHDETMPPGWWQPGLAARRVPA